jgi:hypothetical protein
MTDHEGSQVRDVTVCKGYRLFPTALGVAGVAWSSQGLVGVELPDASTGKPLERLRAAAGTGAPSDAPCYDGAAGGPIPRPLSGPTPPWVEDAVARLTRYFEGTPEDFSSLPRPIRHDAS